MSFLGVPEVAALTCDWQHNCVYGVRIKHRSRGVFTVSKYASGEHADWTVAAAAVLKELGVNSSIYLVLSLVLEGSEVFECTVPAAAPDVVRDALRFEVPRHVMSVPEKFRLQYTACSGEAPEGSIRVRCAVFAEDVLHKLCNQLAKFRCRPDAVINPLLTLPAELKAEAKVRLSGFDENFCWQYGQWQLSGNSAAECNNELDTLLKEHCCGDIFDGVNLEGFRTALTAALFGAGKLFTDNSVLSGVTVLPDYMRPARYRTQLRVMALLLLLLLGMCVFRYGGGFIEKYREYNKLSAHVRNAKSKVQTLRKKVKANEKELKELQRTAELNIGSRDCIGYLGYISDKLPNEALVTNFRWNEGSLDMNFQTNSAELDMVAFFNRLAGFKVVNASQRRNPMNNFTIGNVKLTVIEAESELAKLQRLSKKKSKSKGKK